jgi:GGDEF domain-containing protein
VVAAWNDLPPSGEPTECATLVELAERLHDSAPELVVPYARRVLEHGPGAEGSVVIRAQALLAAALVRLGRHAEAVEPALVALRGADHSGIPELASSVRLDLAACSVGLGEPLLGCPILRPVLDTAGARPGIRAGAIAQLVGCSVHVGRRDDLEDSLAEADRLLAADDRFTADARRLERALLAARAAAYHRRWGETEDAVEAARNGLGLLARLRDVRLEGGRARAGLALELVCALLDDGHLAEAEQEAGPVLGQPVRAASAPAVGRLLLAVATRVLLPAGRVEAGRGLLDHATWVAERHALDWLLADGLAVRADLEERAARPADALRTLREAHAAEHRHRRSVELARRRLMTEFGAGDYPLDIVHSLLRNVIRPAVAVAPAVRATPETAGARAVPPPPAAPPPLPGTRPPVPDPLGVRSRTVAPPGGAGTRADEPKAAPPESGEPETDEATGLLTRAGLSRRLAAVRRGDRPVALTLVRLETEGETGGRPGAGAGSPGPGTEALTTLAGHVRDIAPEGAELARPAGSELAVLLPHTTRDQAERLAATIRESALGSDWLTEATGPEVSISTGVAQSGLDPAPGEDADYLLTAARQTLTTADRPDPIAPDPSAGDYLRTAARESLVTADRPDPIAPDLNAEESFLTALAAATDPETRRPTLERGDHHATPATEARHGLAGSNFSAAEPATPREPPDTLHHRAESATVARNPAPVDAPDAPIGTAAAVDTSTTHGAADHPFEWNGSPAFAGAPGEHSDARDPRDVERDSFVADRPSGPTEFPTELGEWADLPEWQGVADVEPGAGRGRALYTFEASELTGVREPSGGEDGPGLAIRELLAPLLDHPTLSHPEDRYATPEPEREPDEIPEPPPPRPGIFPTEPDDEPPRPPRRPDIVIPPEPDNVPPIAPGPEPTPDVPPPASIPEEPERPEDDHPDAVLGPVQGPEPRPPDLPPREDRTTLRRPAADTTSIADLLTEALVAYQATAPEDDEPEPAPPVPAPPEPTPEATPPAHRTGAGRHRMPDWASLDFDTP